MHIEERRKGQDVLVSLHGDLIDAGTGRTLERIVHRAAVAGRRMIVVDLAGVAAIDAAGLGALARAERASRATMLPLALVHVPPRVRRLLSITHLTTVIEICESVEQALREVGVPRRSPLYDAEDSWSACL